MKVAFFAAALLTMSTTALQLNSQYAAAEQTDDRLVLFGADHAQRFWCDLRQRDDLNFFGTFGNSIPAVVAIDVLKRLVPGVAHTTVYLHGKICRFATQPVRLVIAHGDFVRDRECTVFIHQPGRFVNECP